MGVDHDSKIIRISEVMEILRVTRRWRCGIRLERDSTRGVACRRLSCRMQRLKERDQSRRLRGAPILPVRGHVATALDHLPNQLILCQPNGHGIESRSALSALIVERVAVVTLLHLENEGALALERGAVVQKLGRNRNSTPCVHHRAPRCISSETRKRSQRDCHEQNREYGNRPAPPAFFAFTEKERQEQESENYNHGPDKQSGSFHGRRQEREYGVEPQEEKIRTRRGLNDRRIQRA